MQATPRSMALATVAAVLLVIATPTEAQQLPSAVPSSSQPSKLPDAGALSQSKDLVPEKEHRIMNSKTAIKMASHVARKRMHARARLRKPTLSKEAGCVSGEDRCGIGTVLAYLVFGIGY